MRLIQLQYPDEASQTKILDDLTQLQKNIGQSGHRAVIVLDKEGDEVLESIATKLQQRGIATVQGEGGVVLTDDEVIVEDGDSFEITGGSVSLTVSGGDVTGGTFTADEG